MCVLLLLLLRTWQGKPTAVAHSIGKVKDTLCGEQLPSTQRIRITTTTALRIYCYLSETNCEHHPTIQFPCYAYSRMYHRRCAPRKSAIKFHGCCCCTASKGEIPRRSFGCCCGCAGTAGVEVMLFHILELHIGIHIRPLGNAAKRRNFIDNWMCPMS